VLWVALLWLPLVQMVFHPFPEARFLTEKRARERPPALRDWSPSGLKTFAEGFDRYFGDNFGFRDLLIGTHAGLMFKLLRTSPTESVVLGKDGWLYYSSPSDGINLQDFSGLATLTGSQLLAIDRNVSTLAARLRAEGVAFALLVAPGKPTIYPEHLPDGIRPLAGRTMFDQLSQHFAGRRDLLLVDPRPALLAAKGDPPLYYKTDTHWTEYGAWVAYRVLAAALAREGVPIAVPRAEDFRTEAGSAGPRDLGVMLGVPGDLREAGMRVRLSQAKPARVTRLPAAPGDDPELAPLSCDTGDPGLPHLLMFGDSFALGLQPYLCQDFSLAFHYAKNGISWEIIAREKPQVVVLEITERYLGMLRRNAYFKGIAAPPAPRTGLPGAKAPDG
jgi:alginate O-acetyltransferase complex protein AlgJ